MSYCTLTDLTERYGAEVAQWADRDQDGTPDPELIAAATADVDAEIDAYLAARYTLPLSTVPTVVVRIACALVRERLALANGARMDAVDPIKAESGDARKLLQAIGSGKASIGVPNPAQTTDGVQMQTGGRLWDRTQSGGYV